MYSDLLYLLSISPAIHVQQSYANPVPPPCNPLPPLNSEGQYVGVGPIKATITADSPNGCTKWTPVNENNWCGPQQIQAYAYKPGTNGYADTLYVQVVGEHSEGALSHTTGAYTAKTFHTHEHVTGNIVACTYPAEDVEAVDLYLRVIYWPWPSTTT